MGLFIRQDDNRSELQARVAAELREKAKMRADKDNQPKDGVNDSAYLKGTKQTTSLAWVWVLIFLTVVGLIIWLLFTYK